MLNMHMPSNESIYTREGDFAVFNQLGVKLNFNHTTPKNEYYDWLDRMIGELGKLVPGAEIAEKSYARAEPRLNTGIYYDTVDHQLLRSGVVLRTTCNKKTHAFCAFKYEEDENGVRRDHRYVFEGTAKSTIQNNPSSPESVSYVKQLLARTDIEHPGTHLYKITGIKADQLAPAICLEQYRHPFFVWLDKKDALRCSMDRVEVYNLRLSKDKRVRVPIGEIELPIYPHLEEEVANDPRVLELIEVLADSVREHFGVDFIYDSKYRRAARALELY